MTTTQNTQSAPKVGTTLRYVGPRPERDVPSWMLDLVSFRRANQWGSWEVFTSDGSRNIAPEHLAPR